MSRSQQLLRSTLTSAFFMAVITSLLSCASKPVLDADDIKVTRDQADQDCKSLGPIDGRVITAKGTQEQAMENLKEEAVKKGANFVTIESIGAQGTTIRGQAYSCP